MYEQYVVIWKQELRNETRAIKGTHTVIIYNIKIPLK